MTFDLAVDLPADRKGSDLSRNAEILAEVVDRSVHQPTDSLESTCSSIARELLARHPTASEATVHAEADYFLTRGVAPERQSYEDYRLVARALARRTDRSDLYLRRGVGAEAVGMTVCPCAMETARDLLTRSYPALEDPSWKGLPVVSHNQRNRTRLVLDFDGALPVEVDDLIAAIESAFSSPTYAILKRGDEGAVVVQAHQRPKFVEDVVRDLLATLPGHFARLPDGVDVEVRSVSEESIHKYDVEASHRTTLGELRRAAPP